MKIMVTSPHVRCLLLWFVLGGYTDSHPKNQCFLVLFFVHVRIFGSLMIKCAEIFYSLTRISTIGNIRACFNTINTNFKSKQHGDTSHKSAEYFKI